MKSISMLILFVLASTCTFAQAVSSESSNTIKIEDAYWPLNSENKADAYSWLSKDGLRLYFTRDNSIDEIWKATRKSLNEPFSNPESLSIEGLAGDNEVFSSWLTSDENTIYFITREDNVGYSTSLYKANYDKINNKFTNPIKINLGLASKDDESDIFISGPSLTNDLTQLYVYYSEPGDGGDRIASFTSTDGLNYTFKNFLNNAENYCPGSISSDGLSFYLTLREQKNTLVKLSRTDLNSDFSNPIYFLIDTSAHSGKNYYQPNVNTELGILSITYGLGSWETNDLDVIKMPTQISTEPIIAKVEVPEDYDLNLEPIELVDSAVATYIETDDLAILIEDTCCASAVESLPTLPPDPDFETEDIITLQRVSNPHKKIKFESMPNPASNVFHINYDFEGETNGNLVFELMDLNGRLIKHFMLEENAGSLDVDISQIAEGIYIYRISSPNFINENKRLLVKR
jgi:hypothetical protein